MTRRRLAVALGLSALLAFPPGCISYTLDRLPLAGELPAPRVPEQRPSLICSVRASGDESDIGEALGDLLSGVAKLDREIQATLVASGQFRSVDVPAPDRTGDLQLDIVMQVHDNASILIVGGLTLFIIPTWRTITFELTAEARTPSGAWKRYHLVDAARDIHWLPMILVMSFWPWSDAYSDVRTNLYRTLLVQLHEDGFLAPPG